MDWKENMLAIWNYNSTISTPVEEQSKCSEETFITLISIMSLGQYIINIDSSSSEMIAWRLTVFKDNILENILALIVEEIHIHELSL